MGNDYNGTPLSTGVSILSFFSYNLLLFLLYTKSLWKSIWFDFKLNNHCVIWYHKWKWNIWLSQNSGFARPTQGHSQHLMLNSLLLKKITF